MDKYSEIIEVVAADFQAVDDLIKTTLQTDVPLISTLSEHILNAGGKRMRPLLVLLSAHACGCTDREQAIQCAAIIELVHTATLLHDDVVDDSEKRRGKPTANSLWGNEASVLVGDFLYSKAFQLISLLPSATDIMPILARSTHDIAEGEVLQLINRNNVDIDTETYLTVIMRKTAKLFEVSAQLGALLAQQHVKAFSQYGLSLGMAFQLIDDILDITASTHWGKNPGDDFSQGCMTLPLIHLLKQASATQKKAIYAQVAHPEATLLPFETLKTWIIDAGGIEITQQQAHQQLSLARESIMHLPDSPSKSALLALTQYAQNRTH